MEGKRNKEENCYSMTVNELKKVPVPVVVVDKRHSQRIMDLSFKRAAAMAGCSPLRDDTYSDKLLHMH